VIYFKIFKDRYNDDGSCVDVLNDYVNKHPDHKIVFTKLEQYTESRIGPHCLNRWDKENTYTANRVFAQFMTEEHNEEKLHYVRKTYPTRRDRYSDAWDNAWNR
jgi:hypothetical protein